MWRLATAAAAALFAALPAQAATLFSTVGSWGRASFPGYFDGTGGAGYMFTLNNDLPDQAERVIGLSDLASIHVSWAAMMRVSNITNERRESIWETDAGGIESFSARIKTENSKIRIIEIALRTKTVSPYFGTANLPPTYVEIDLYTFHFTDGAGNGSSGFMYTNVPEPAAWALMLAGFGVAGLSIRLRQRASLSRGHCRSDHRGWQAT